MKDNQRIYKAELLINEYDVDENTRVLEIWTLQGQLIAKTEVKKPQETK